MKDINLLAEATGYKSKVKYSKYAKAMQHTFGWIMVIAVVALATIFMVIHVPFMVDHRWVMIVMTTIVIIACVIAVMNLRFKPNRHEVSYDNMDVIDKTLKKAKAYNLETEVITALLIQIDEHSDEGYDVEILCEIALGEWIK